jgi:hypothetical protein
MMGKTGEKTLHNKYSRNKVILQQVKGYPVPAGLNILVSAGKEHSCI